MTKLYMFVDVETTGKNYTGAHWRNNEMLSISYLLANEHLEILKTNSFIVKQPETVVYDMNEYVLNMHTKNGLITKCVNEGISLDEIQTQILNDLNEYKDVTIIPAGNNIQFDVEVVRRNLPKVFELFHYSFLDVTSVRKALAMVLPYEVKKIKDAKKLNHNSDVDCKDARDELVALLEYVKSLHRITL